MSRPRLLLVDDDPDLALIVERLGRRCGHDVAWSPDAENAWQRLEAGRPDLLLLDHNLPGASGAELCRRLRADPRLHDLAVAAFGHRDRPGDVAACLEAGADAFVSKDLLLDQAAWAARVAEILARPRGRGLPAVLSWTAYPPLTPEQWAARLVQVVHHPTVRPFGLELLPGVLHRALLRVGGAPPPAHASPSEVVAGHCRAVGPEAVVPFAVALLDELWRFLGTAGCEPLHAVLAAPAPASPGTS